MERLLAIFKKKNEFSNPPEGMAGVAKAERGKGKFWFVGDTTADWETQKAIIAMCGLDREHEDWVFL